MNRDYTGFAVESAGRAIKWLREYEENVRDEYYRDFSKILLKKRIKKLELAQKNLKQAISEIEVEIAFLNRGLE